MKPTIIKAYLRLGIAGGGSDLKPFVLDHESNILNITISKSIDISIKQNNDTFLIINNGLYDTKIFDSKKLPLLSKTSPLHIATCIYFFRKIEIVPTGIEISIDSHLPVGTGLGVSSTVCVTILRILYKFYNISVTNFEITAEAEDIERNLLKMPGGKQDYYPSIFNGMNLITFFKNNVELRKVKLSKKIQGYLNDDLVLLFYNIDRQSKKIIQDQIKRIKKSKKSKYSILQKMSNYSLLCEDALLKNDYHSFIELFNESTKLKDELSPFITPNKIKDLLNSFPHNYIKAWKISGAGGGGAIMLLVNPEKKRDIIQFAIKNGLNYISTNFVF